MSTRTALVLILLLGGCKTWATPGAHEAVVEMPAKVNRGEKFFFTVTMKDASGAALDGVAYQWKVDWVGLPGSVHKGKAGVEQRINVKGATGTGMLSIFGYDASGQMLEMAKREFKVE